MKLNSNQNHVKAKLNISLTARFNFFYALISKIIKKNIIVNVYFFLTNMLLPFFVSKLDFGKEL